MGETLWHIATKGRKRPISTNPLRTRKGGTDQNFREESCLLSSHPDRLSIWAVIFVYAHIPLLNDLTRGMVGSRDSSTWENCRFFVKPRPEGRIRHAQMHRPCHEPDLPGSRHRSRWWGAGWQSFLPSPRLSKVLAPSGCPGTIAGSGCVPTGAWNRLSPFQKWQQRRARLGFLKTGTRSHLFCYTH